jgi:hypothetical protein
MYNQSELENLFPSFDQLQQGAKLSLNARPLRGDLRRNLGANFGRFRMAGDGALAQKLEEHWSAHSQALAPHTGF